MKLINSLVVVVLLVASLTSCASIADESAAKNNYRVRLFFGLSLPSGGGVSLKQWEAFQNGVLAKAFDGFNVVDSTGFYQGEPERSKVVTLIVKEAEMDKVKKVASQYATLFNQDSVMMVKVKVDEWTFIGKAN